MGKIIALVALLVTVLILGYTIEQQARPSTGRQGIHREGEHVH